MINLIISPSYRKFVEASIIKQSVDRVLDFLKISDKIDINIVIKSDQAIRKLNKQYLDTDSPTDVLSFLANEMDPETSIRLLGDIIISFPTALRQAEDANVPVEQELQILVVHGLLHLLGYDHQEITDMGKMWSIQEAILHQLGIDSFRAS